MGIISFQWDATGLVQSEITNELNSMFPALSATEYIALVTPEVNYLREFYTATMSLFWGLTTIPLR